MARLINGDNVKVNKKNVNRDASLGNPIIPKKKKKKKKIKVFLNNVNKLISKKNF
jgi:hypothetical protein